ncbi:GerAB/ArcD/ProY family transporter [Paenibacillus sp. DMB5]|uniref:GerAB/ArcD/ProY family transporter n=1 Tax=Paenibacillus sp. DMB5 TaxID=1780103 RepID=UPI00076CDE49|nr:GerAB/ArcD/ProY family transporter [Paenibacillus sp. DMB5]KUP25811.1 spore gernimation protein [Paenibacillus sp. DMB5]
MANKSHVRVSELATTLALFEVGSTSLFLIGGDAKQDAWLAMFVGALAGLILLLMHLIIHRTDPGLDLFQLNRRYTGKYLGGVINLAFIGYFALEASRNLRDMGEVTLTILLSGTPLWSVMLIVVLVVSNTVRYGPEVLFLMCMVLLPFITIGYIFIAIMVMATHLIHFDHMLPVLEYGWGRVFKAAIPDILSFPFGQVVVFLSFYPLTSNRSRIVPKVIAAYCASALFLIILNQINILVLGPVIATNSALPLLQTVQLIQLTKVIERIDPVFTMILFLSLGIKLAVFFNGAVAGMTRVTGFTHKKMTLFIGVIIYILAFLSPTYTEFIKVGREIAVKYWWPVFQIALPALLLITMYLRKGIRQRGKT